MKTISKSLPQSNVTRWIRRSLLTLALAVSSPVLSAQDTKEASTPTGFIRIANAIAPGTGNVNVVIDGNDVYPSGYKFGAVTGGIGLPPGGHSVTIRRAGVKEGTTKVNVEKNQTVTLIPFAERVPATDQEPAHFAIRILRLKQKETQGARSASFVSVSGMPELLAELRAPSGDWAKVPVKRLAIGETPILYPEGYAPVRVNGKEMEPIPVGDPGNYVVVLYDDAEGNIKTVSFRDFKFLSAD
jgi:hypothetical protein